MFSEIINSRGTTLHRFVLIFVMGHYNGAFSLQIMLYWVAVSSLLFTLTYWEVCTLLYASKCRDISLFIQNKIRRSFDTAILIGRILIIVQSNYGGCGFVWQYLDWSVMLHCIMQIKFNGAILC
jgi:hypothetical protein